MLFPVISIKYYMPATPSLFLSKKIEAHGVLHREEIISPYMRDLILRRFFINGSLDADGQQAITKFLHRQRELGRWIACSCKPSEEAAFTIKMLNEKIYIATVPSRKQHAQDCPFAREIIISPVSAAAPPAPRVGLLEDGVILNLHRDTRNESDAKNDSYVPSMTGASWREPKLLRILWSLVHSEKLNIITHTTLPIKDQLAKIHAATIPYFLDRDLRMADFFGTSFSAIKDIKARLIESREKWSNCRPHGLILVRCKDIEEKTLVLSDKFSFPLKRLARPGLESTKGPHIAIFTIAEPPEKQGRGWFEGLMGAACPISDWNTLVPVESNKERVALSRLRWYFYVSKAALPATVIIKPLIDVMDDSGEIPIRPDFLIQHNNRQVVLEIMGFDDVAYQDRKERTIPLMRNKFGEVFTYAAYNSDPDGKVFFSILREIKKQLD